MGVYWKKKLFRPDKGHVGLWAHTNNTLLYTSFNAILLRPKQKARVVWIFGCKGGGYLIISGW